MGLVYQNKKNFKEAIKLFLKRFSRKKNVYKNNASLYTILLMWFASILNSNSRENDELQDLF
jgi:hypothetical protein